MNKTKENFVALKTAASDGKSGIKIEEVVVIFSDIMTDIIDGLPDVKLETNNDLENAPYGALLFGNIIMTRFNRNRLTSAECQRMETRISQTFTKISYILDKADANPDDRLAIAFFSEELPQIMHTLLLRFASA